MKIAFRNLSKRPGFTFINVFGLAIGVACCLLISLYVINELSYDRFLHNADRIYRIKQTSISPDKEEASATTPFRVGPTVDMEYPGLVKNTVRFYDMQESPHTLLDRESDRSYRESNFYFVDSTFFEVFGAELLRGNAREVLDEPLSLVMTEERARLYFGDENPIGKTLSFHGIRSMSMTVTGIMKSWPDNSHMKPEVLASFSSVDVLYRRNPGYDESWFWNPVWTYIELEEGISAEELAAQLPRFADKYYHADRPEAERIELELQPVTDIHLYSKLDQEMNPNGSIFSVYLFSAIAILLLLIACINFMNLATARSADRSREVGLRKVMGADRWELFKQFMGESYLLTFLSLILALLMVYGSLPWFNAFLDKNLGFNLFLEPAVIAGTLGLFLMVGLLAGIYPALYLSGFNPTRILKGEAVKGRRGMLFRKGLVIFQFSLSVMLIVGTLVVYLQLQHMQSKNLGFDQSQIMILPMKQNLIAWEYDRFRQAAIKSPAIQSISATSKIPGSDKQHYWKIYPADTPQGEKNSTMTLHVTHNFLETYGIDVVAGRSFSREYPTDGEKAVLVNREMVSKLGLEEARQVLGKQFYYDASEGERKTYTVVGVVENFHYTSVKKEIKPLVIRLADGTRPILQTIRHAVVRVAPGSMNEAISHLEKSWGRVNHVDPFEYRFQQEELDKIYAAEMRVGKLSATFTLLCILVACLGLFGLSSFSASRRTGEIGIRKTLGATAGGIVLLLSREYMKLVALANLAAWPVIYYLVMNWLRDFPYRISLGWNMVGIMAATTLASLLICLLTVGYQSVKAALINPAESIYRE